MEKLIMNAFERNCIGSRTNLRQNCGMNEWVNNWASLIFVFYLPFGRSIRGYVGRSIGWLVGRLVNRSVSWLVGRSVGWSVCQSVCQSVGWLVGRSVPNSFLVWLSVEGWILAMNLFSLSRTHEGFPEERIKSILQFWSDFFMPWNNETTTMKTTQQQQ